MTSHPAISGPIAVTTKSRLSFADREAEGACRHPGIRNPMPVEILPPRESPPTPGNLAVRGAQLQRHLKPIDGIERIPLRHVALEQQVFQTAGAGGDNPRSRDKVLVDGRGRGGVYRFVSFDHELAGGV